jgi:formate dehydrogenase major subunit
MPTVTLNLNGQTVTADPGRTILQVARDHGVDIPTLCYDPRLPPYGSCLVCVVEVRSANRLLMSCTTPVAEGMDVWTESEGAMKARKAALEMLLSNHYADCRGPCFLKCPANVDVQGYLAFASAGMYQEALSLIRETNPLPSSCGRVCVRYCEASCRRKDVDSPAAINFMKRYVADLEYDRLPVPVPAPLNGKRVAVVGGGPAGLTCAYFLRTRGYAVTLLDQQPKLGGMLRYGIPEYRLPQAVLDKEVNLLLASGIETRLRQKLGVDFTLDGLKAEGFDALYLSMGSWVAKGMGIENEGHPRILPGIKFLEACKLAAPPTLQGTVAIVGGGNTAIDAARTALRCGADEVAVLYRRTRQEMPADDIEVVDAIEEGIKFHYLTAPRKAVVDGTRLAGLECVRMDLGEPDASGRRRPVEVAGSEFLFQADWIVSAIGQEQDLSGLANETLGEIKLTKWKSIQADPETLQTSVEGVFTGGDVMTGPAAAVDAIGAGRKAAWVIDRWFALGKVDAFKSGFVSRKTSLAPIDPAFFEQFEKVPRGSMPQADKDVRGRTWEEVDLGVTEDQVKHETARCLSCGCNSVFDCDLKVYSGNYDADQERFKGKVKKHKLDDRHPNILLDANKCILCGRCVRYCGELIDVHALGFINRGFETVVKPMLDRALLDTPCVNCGNCIEVCPTGAITFKASLEKPGPFRTAPHRSACSFCGVGCEFDVNHCGRDYFFVTAKPQDDFTEGELCAKGRFGTRYVGSRDRLYSPVLKGRGNVGMIDAALALADGLRPFKGEEILFLASPRVTTEVAYLFGRLARQTGSRFVVAAEDLRRPALPDVTLGSTVAQEEVEKAEVIVTVGEAATAYNPVFGFKVRRALANGARLLHVGGASREWARLADAHLDCPPGAEPALLAALCGVLARNGLGETQAFAYPKAGPDVEAAATLLSGRVVVVANGDANATGDQRELAWASSLASLCGGGLLAVGNEAGGRGFRDVIQGLDFSGAKDFQEAKLLLKRGAIKAVVALGTDLTVLGALRPAFTAVVDIFATPDSAKADLVVPFCPVQEEDGSLVAFDGHLAAFPRAFKPLAGFTNLEFLAEALVQAGGPTLDLKGVRRAIAEGLPRYAPLAEGRPNSHVRAPGAPAFRPAPLEPQAFTPYTTLTTYARIWEPQVLQPAQPAPVG